MRVRAQAWRVFYKSTLHDRKAVAVSGFVDAPNDCPGRADGDPVGVAVAPTGSAGRARARG